MASVYIEFLKRSFQESSTYRVNSYLHVISAIGELIIQVNIWSVLLRQFSSSQSIVAMPDMVNYIIINMIVLALVRSDMGTRIAERVRDGSIAIDFIRPINFKLYLFADELGKNLFRTVFSTLPVCLLAAIGLKFRLPAQPINLLLFGASILNGIFIMYTITYLLGLLAFWLQTSWYVRFFLAAFFELFGGIFVPLWFYPPPLQAISKILPFRLVAFDPITIYLGKTSISAALGILGLQIVWIVVLTALEKYTWAKAQDKITVQGG